MGRVGCVRKWNGNWLAACRVKDQLQPKSPPRRIYNALCCSLGSFGFNSESISKPTRSIKASTHCLQPLATPVTSCAEFGLATRVTSCAEFGQLLRVSRHVKTIVLHAAAGMETKAKRGTTTINVVWHYHHHHTHHHRYILLELRCGRVGGGGVGGGGGASGGEVVCGSGSRQLRAHRAVSYLKL